MGKVLVCRCEDVTQNELEEAIERGHDDIESLKRYTGFGTGWCQGKSCVALCAKLLAERGGDPSLPFTPRPPFHPLRLADLAGLADVAEADAAANPKPPSHG
jgi:bacterioferritin-associated ferredoxin